ncbi:MAG: class I SAM-dependent methyltransferase [Planctomycetota bacterium]
MDRAAFEDMARVEDRHWWFAGKRALLQALLRRTGVPDGARVLDLGCGTGATLASLARRYEAIGVEPDAGARAVCERRGCRVLYGGFPGDLPAGALSDAPAQAAILSDVIEHLDDDAGALRESAALLCPGGVLVVTVPAHPWMWTEHDVALHHRRRYTKRSLREAARTAGLTVQTLTWSNCGMFPLMAAQRVALKAGVVKGGIPGTTPIPASPVNALFRGVYRAEAMTSGRVPHPFGGSLAAVFRTPGR